MRGCLRKREGGKAGKNETFITADDKISRKRTGEQKMEMTDAARAVLDTIRNRRSFSRLNARYSHNRAEGFDPFYGAPVYALVLADSSSSNWLRDGSCVLENMMIAAEALGIGSCWINREEEVFDSVEGKELLKKWGLDAGKIRGVGALALGYAGRAPGRAAPRKKDYIIKV